MKNVKITYYNNIGETNNKKVSVLKYRQPNGSYSTRGKMEFMVDGEKYLQYIAEFLNDTGDFSIDSDEVETLSDLRDQLEENNISSMDEGLNPIETLRINNRLVFKDDDITELIEEMDGQLKEQVEEGEKEVQLEIPLF